MAKESVASKISRMSSGGRPGNVAVGICEVGDEGFGMEMQCCCIL